MKRALITGAVGLLGSNIILTLNRYFEIVATYHQQPLNIGSFMTLPMDITKADETATIISRLVPQVIIHCAAETDVDYCEEHPKEASEINAKGTENLSQASAQVGAKLVYISTDSVFDGQTGMYGEAATPNPINVYAKTKLAGEAAVKKFCEDHLIIRTNIYGWNARTRVSLTEWILDRLNRNQVVPGFIDIFFSPVLVNDLAEIILDMVNADLRGIYHVGTKDSCSKFAFAQVLCEVFDKNASLVQSTTSDSAGFKARRPKNTTLEVNKVSKALGRSMPEIKESLVRFRRLLEDGYVSHLHSLFKQEHVKS